MIPFNNEMLARLYDTLVISVEHLGSLLHALKRHSFPAIFTYRHHSPYTYLHTDYSRRSASASSYYEEPVQLAPFYIGSPRIGSYRHKDAVSVQHGREIR
jgi:hypothetical protein